MTARSRSRSRSRSRRPPARRRGGWPWWVRLVVGGAFVAGVVFVVLWFNALATWVKVLSIVGVVLLVASWWLWTRRHEIRAEMERRGLENAEDIYSEQTKHHADFRLDETSMNDWAEHLIDCARLPEAIWLLTFNVRLHPQSSAAHAALARARARAGDRPGALAGFRDSLALNPGNADARRRIRELERDTPGDPL